MRQTVTIQENENGKIIAGCDKSQCEGCHGSFFCTSKKTDFQVLNPEEIPLEKGDKAVVELESRKTLFSVFMSLVLPVLMFLPGYGIGYLISSRESVHLIFALLSVALGFGISALYFRFTKKAYLPVVVSKEAE